MKQFEVRIDTPLGRVSVDQDDPLPAVRDAAARLENVLGWLDEVSDALHDLDQAAHRLETVFARASLIPSLADPVQSRVWRRLYDTFKAIGEVLQIEEDLPHDAEIEDALFYIEEYLDYMVSEQDDRWPGDR